MLEVELVIVDELKIMYEGVFEGDEATMLVWSIVLRVEHYWWLQGSMVQIEA
jgi:hypothetical protein